MRLRPRKFAMLRGVPSRRVLSPYRYRWQHIPRAAPGLVDKRHLRRAASSIAARNNANKTELRVRVGSSAAAAASSCKFGHGVRPCVGARDGPKHCGGGCWRSQGCERGRGGSGVVGCHSRPPGPEGKAISAPLSTCAVICRTNPGCWKRGSVFPPAIEGP